MEIGKRIRQLRQLQNITVNKLANRAGISQSYLRDIELGNKKPTIEYLEYICDALDVTIPQFFSSTQEKDDRLQIALRKLSPAQKKFLIRFLESLPDCSESDSNVDD